MAQYQALEAPFSVDYVTGWQQFYDYAPTVSMLTCLIACFLVAGIFSQEGTLRAEAVFFATRHGRGRGTGAKIGAGLPADPALLVGRPGLCRAHPGTIGGRWGQLPVQVIHWKSFYSPHLGPGGLLIALGAGWARWCWVWSPWPCLPRPGLWPWRPSSLRLAFLPAPAEQ